MYINVYGYIVHLMDESLHMLYTKYVPKIPVKRLPCYFKITTIRILADFRKKFRDKRNKIYS